MCPYIVVSLATGLRTEEVRALTWDRVDLDGDEARRRPTSVQVWRSVRKGGDTKTKKSRRTLAPSDLAVAALRRLENLSAHVIDGIGDMLLTKLTPKHIEKLLANLAQTHSTWTIADISPH